MRRLLCIVLLSGAACAAGAQDVQPSGSVADRRPLEPAAHPLYTHPVNRDRIYDFYAKQALDYLGRKDKPRLLPPFPGLDGGPTAGLGHFGRMTEEEWMSDRWSRMMLGPAQGCVLQLDRPIPRAVCIQVGSAAACFDPDTLTWPAAWSGGFLKFGTVRFGFLGQFTPNGEMLAAPGGEPASMGSFTYHGYYVHGDRVIFAYRREGAEWLESATLRDGRVIIDRQRLGEGPLTQLTRGGPARSPELLVTRGELGDGRPYAIDTLRLPPQTPWNSLWHIGDHDFFPNGDAALCTFEGEVWIVSGIDDALSRLTWRRFATGLNQGLGLRIVDGKVCVLGRDQVTRLHDLNGDGEADFYESLCRSYDSSPGGHDFIMGLQRDQEGRFYFASGRQGIVRTSADSSVVEVLARGMRNPNAPGLGPGGEVAFSVQEGEWTPTSMVYEWRPGLRHVDGYRGETSATALLPLLYLPRGEDHSSGGSCYVEGDRWGVPAGTLVHLSWGNGRAFLVLREKIGDLVQGTAIPLPGDFRSGVHRGRFHSRDGQLYVSGMTGWITYTPDEGCFQRVRYTGGPVQVPVATEARDNGILLRFAQRLEGRGATDRSRFFAQQWNYQYAAAYGSEEYSVRSLGHVGHDPLEIAGVHMLSDGRSLFVEIPQLQPSHVLHLHCRLPKLLSRDFFMTLHRLGPPFTEFAGYRPIAKRKPHAHHHAATDGAPPAPVEWEQGAPGRSVAVQTAAGLQYVQKEIRARPGERLSLTLENPDVMPHNWVLVRSDAVERVGAMANLMITAPDALAHHYVPDTPDVLCHTRVVDPGQKTTIHFDAPVTPGRYPYLCTFPGHWAIMKGVLVVE
jgi:azurin